MLEPRRLLSGASIVVDTASDVVNAGDGVTSLREAIARGNADVSGDTITFANSLNGQTIVLTQGVLKVSGSMTITGLGASLLAIDGNHQSGIFDIENGAHSTSQHVSISGLTIQHGYEDASIGNLGAIYNEGTLTLSNNTITNNTSDGGASTFSSGAGAGICNQGVLNSTGNTITHNSVSGTSGGTNSQGGGISNEGTLTSTGDVITDNSANVNGLGGGVYNLKTMTLIGDTIANNTAVVGGGIYNNGFFANQHATLINCVITGNSANRGGGVVNYGGVIDTTGNTIGGNTAATGGGIWNYGGNGSTSTGVFTSSGDAIIGNSTTLFGGGVYNENAAWKSTNDTIANNSAGTLGGGIYVRAEQAVGTVLTTVNDTIAGNSSQSGGGAIYVNDYTTWISRNTIVAANQGGGDVAVVSTGHVTFNANNTLIGDATLLPTQITSGTGNILHPPNQVIFVTDGGGAPLLANNGGPTKTIGLAAGSPAIGMARALTSLSANINDTATTTYTVADPTCVLVGDELKVGDEVVKVTGISHNNLTVLRGQLGTTAAVHAAGDQVLLATDQTGAVRIIQDIGARQGTQHAMVVDTSADTHQDGHLTLREAVTQANIDGSGDTITFAVSTNGQPITLTHGVLSVTGSMTISGNGSSNTIIDGGWDGVFGDNVGTQIFNINSASPQSVAIIGVMLQHGNSGGSGFGGAIKTNRNLTLTNGTIANNSALIGAGIEILGGSVTATNVIFTGNIASAGGGIDNSTGTLTLSNSTIANNSASAGGGGIYNSGKVISSNNTISGNVSAIDGAGINNNNGGDFNSTNDTIANNSANQIAGIYNVGVLTTTNDTIANNSATGANTGGIFMVSGGAWNAINTIVAGNSGGDVDNSTSPGTINASHTLIGDSSVSGTGITNNIGYGAIFGANVLANNGGPTQTIALTAGSPAIGTAAALGALSAAIADTTGTTISVSDATYLAIGDNLAVDDEIMTVTGIAGTTVTVQRAQLGTTAATHSGTADVRLASDQRGLLRSGSVFDIGSFESQPVLGNGSVLNYTENDPASAIDPGLSVVDLSQATLASATVTFANFVLGQDQLAFTNDGSTMGDIAVSNNANGTLTLVSSGATATVAQWQAALRAVTYANASDNPTTATRIVQFVANDGVKPGNTLTSTIAITSVDDAPVLAVAGNITSTENDPATAIDTGLTVSDLDNATLAGATVTIVNFVAGQDVLAFANIPATMGNIVVSTNVGGVLTLTSAGATATRAQWEAALRAVTYANTSDNPNPTSRLVEFVVNDGSANSNTLTSAVAITAVNDAAVLAVAGNITYTENGAATAVDSGITVTDVDNTTLASATVTITNFVSGQDQLAFTNDGSTMGNIAVSSNSNGVLILTSSGAAATVAQWQAALRAVTYANSSDNPLATSRSVEFVVNDGLANSNTLTGAIAIAPVDDAPVLSTAGNIAYTESGPAAAIDTGITVSDLDNTTLVGATVTITNFVGGQDLLAFANDGSTMGNIAVSTNSGGVLTLTSAGSTATTGQWQAALRAVTYSNSSQNPNTTARSINFVVNDGTKSSVSLSSTINITPIDNAPVLQNIEVTALPYAPNAAATAMTANLSLSDVDNTSLTGATVKIAAGYQAGDVLGFSNTSNITGVFNAGNGTLTLTGVDTVASYQAALRSVTYASSSQSPASRTVSFQVNDGSASSNIALRSVGGYSQLVGATLNVYGTPQLDVISLVESSVLTVVVDGNTSQFNAVAVTAVNIYGFDGNDSIQINSLTGGTTLSAFGGNGNDTIRVATSVVVGVTLNGGADNDLLFGGSGNDLLIGGNGNDWMTGGDGNDTSIGGLGDDRYLFGDTTSDQTDIVSENSGEGTDLLDFSALTAAVTVKMNSDILLATMAHRVVQTSGAGKSANFENATGGAGDDSITGNAAHNVIYGNAGNDTIYGNGDSDQLMGGDGNDVLDGGAGDDYMVGGNGNDVISGGAGNNSLEGDAGNDVLDGGSGNAWLVGGTGNDTYYFSAAAVDQIDTLVELVGEGTDTLNFAAMTTAVNTNLSSDAVLAGMTHRLVKTGGVGQAANFENVTGGSGSDNIIGNAANNILIGNAGNDTLTGGGGNDILIGGIGNDALVGGASGRSILIGDAGADLLKAGSTGDLLLGGTYLYENDSGVMNALLREWVQPASYQSRVNHLQGMPGGANSGYYLKFTTISDDRAIDYLVGAAGVDWYLANSLQDALVGKTVDEIFTHIDDWA